MATGPNWPLPVPSYGPAARRPRGSWLSKVIAVLFPALLALPYLPDSIRSILPEPWRARIPRVEFMRDARDGRGVLGAADSAKVDESSAMAGGLSLDAAALEESEDRTATESVHVSKIPRSRRTGRRIVQPLPEEVVEPEDVQYVPDHAVFMIPTRIQTEIRLASAPEHEGAETAVATRSGQDAADAADPDPSRAEGYANQDWPVLCGQVVDESAAPVAGARVELESPRLTVSTDASGRFCVACPAGNCTVRIEAPGRGHATRIVALQESLYDLRIALSQSP